MTDHPERARDGDDLPGDSSEANASRADSVRIDKHLVLTRGRVAFADPERAATYPTAWLALLEAALDRNAPIAESAMELVRAQTAELPADTLLWGSVECSRLLGLLVPRPGLAARLSEMHACGVLSKLFPAFYRDGQETHSFAAIANLERLLEQPDQAGTRFGSMLRELDAPELVVLALLLHDPAGSKAHEPARAADLAQPALDRLQLEGGTRQAIDFLIENQLQLAQFAFRQDTADPQVIAAFASILTMASQLSVVSTEEHLKMLCLLTVADLGAAAREPLTVWKTELVWRLFVATCHYLAMAYGDETIDQAAAARTALYLNRPADLREAELVRFLEGLPQRYLTLFDADAIYEHVRLWRSIGPDDVYAFLRRNGTTSELTVVTLDRPFLFSNICGVLASLGADILRGQALTSRSGLVIDVFEFADERQAVTQSEVDHLLGPVVTGRVDITARLADTLGDDEEPAPAAPLLSFDNERSQRFTVLELVASDAPGLLHRISRALSDFGCEIDLVLISTEADKAIDVFHMLRTGEKLTESEQLALTEYLERAIEGLV